MVAKTKSSYFLFPLRKGVREVSNKIHSLSAWIYIMWRMSENHVLYELTSHTRTLLPLFYHFSWHIIAVCFLFFLSDFLFCFVLFCLPSCHRHHAVIIQRKEADCPAMPKACTCTQDSKGPPGPAGPPVSRTQIHGIYTHSQSDKDVNDLDHIVNTHRLSIDKGSEQPNTHNITCMS